MQLIDLGKLRFNFSGEWDVSTIYETNDVVRYGGNVYVYVYSLSSSGTLPTDTEKWSLMIEGLNFEGVFDSLTEYQVGDGVAHGGKVYISIKDSVNQTPPNAEYWSPFVDGIQYEGEYSDVTAYQKNDVIKYGGCAYIAKQDTTGNNPVDTEYWEKFVDGISASSVYDEAISYVPNDIVLYGTNLYKAIQNTTGNVPTDTEYWEIFLGGFEYSGLWVTSQDYLIGEIVKYGGNTYQALESHTSTIFQDDLDADKWMMFNGGVEYRNTWLTATWYRVDDIVKDGISSYICLEDHTSGDFTTDLGEGKWELFARGAEDVLPEKPTNGQGLALTIASDGINFEWLTQTASENVYYVAPHGTDTPTAGKTLAAPFASLKYACEYAAQQEEEEGVYPLSTIFIKSGTYYEQLPIIVPPNCGIFGDNQRSTTIRPIEGEPSDWREIEYDEGSFVARDEIECVETGATGVVMFVDKLHNIMYYEPTSEGIVFEVGDVITCNTNTSNVVAESVLNNENAFMFLMSNGTLFQFCNLKGMTGWSPGEGDDVTTTIPKGVGFSLNPFSPIVTASPYILDSAAFFLGGIGGYVDGTVHENLVSNRSILFHAFTNINDNGIGYWTRNGATAELVSCFTYYCWVGYTATEGGWVRSLNGSNSWGKYGVIGRGYELTETPKLGSTYGSQIEYGAVTGEFLVGDTITGLTSGATAEIIDVQFNVDKIIVNITSGEFIPEEEFVATNGVQAVIGVDGVVGVSGALYVLTNLSEEPRPGASIEFDGAEYAYVIQTVSGSFVDSSSKIVIILAQESPENIEQDTLITIRYDYSQVRLTGHDFLNVGTGGIATTNLPNAPLQPPSQGNEVIEVYPGRVYYVTTDQSGNFRVGEFFAINQGTGKATLNASAFDLSGLTSLRLGSVGAKIGEMINEFSSDTSFTGDSNSAVPTEHATLVFVDTEISKKSAFASLLTGEYDGAEVEYDSKGRIVGYNVGDGKYVVTNITYTPFFDIPSQPYYAITSYTETYNTGLYGVKTNQVNISYINKKINTITIS